MIIQTFLTEHGESHCAVNTPAEAEYHARRVAAACRFDSVRAAMRADLNSRLSCPYTKPALGRCARVRANIKARYAEAHPKGAKP